MKNQFQAAVEEFGEDAYRRFECRTHYENGGVSNWSCLDGNNLYGREIRLKPIPDLIANDIDVYGDKACWMWKYGIKFDSSVFVNLSDNDTLLSYSKKYTMRRKTSAALPFDLERAENGDVVEIRSSLFCDRWENLADKRKGFTKRFSLKDIESTNRVTIWITPVEMISADLSDLRMKYPPKLRQGSN